MLHVYTNIFLFLHQNCCIFLNQFFYTIIFALFHNKNFAFLHHFLCAIFFTPKFLLFLHKFFYTKNLCFSLRLMISALATKSVQGEDASYRVRISSTLSVLRPLYINLCTSTLCQIWTSYWLRSTGRSSVLVEVKFGQKSRK